MSVKSERFRLVYIPQLVDIPLIIWFILTGFYLNLVK